MGNPRPRPERLADKLRQIREGLELSQTQMLASSDWKTRCTTAASRNMKTTNANPR